MVNPIHLGLKQESNGSIKLTVSSGPLHKEVDCKMAESGLFGSIKSAFLNLTEWTEIKHQEQGHEIHVFIKKSDLEALKREGINISDVQKVSQSFSNVFPTQLTQSIEEFFGTDDDLQELKAEHFLIRIQEFVASGGKKLNLDGMFNKEGRCPDIFDDPLFSKLEELSLKGIKELPDSIGSLSSLKDLDVSHSPLIYLPDSFKKLTNLEYLNLACSGMNKQSAVIEAGREYRGGSFTSQLYEEVGVELVISDLFKKLEPLTKLKAVNMASENLTLGSGQSLNAKRTIAGKTDVVKYTESSRWRD